MSAEGQERFQTLHELAKAAKLRLNADIWDYLVGATETETTLKRNRALDMPGLKLQDHSRTPRISTMRCRSSSE